MWRNYKYKKIYIIDVNSMHGVSEYEPKEETLELFKKEKEKAYDIWRMQAERWPSSKWNENKIEEKQTEEIKTLILWTL